MRAVKAICFMGIMAGSAMPAFADDMMAPSMSMMKAGETVAVMPDGHMGTMMANSMAADAMMKMATPVDHCVMMTMGADGKIYMVDTSSDKAMKECEGMAK